MSDGSGEVCGGGLGGTAESGEEGGGSDVAAAAAEDAFEEGEAFGDAFLGGVFARAEAGADFAEVKRFEKAEEKGLAIFVGKFEEGVVEFLGEDGFVVVGLHLHGGFLAAAAAEFSAEMVAAFEKGRLVKPGGNVFAMTEESGFAGESDEDGLGDFFSLRSVGEFAESGSVNERGVAFHQFGEGRLGSARRIFAEQFLIAAFVHSPV